MDSLTPQPARLVERLALVAILVLAFLMASIPHWEYPYPLHIDEWWHYGDAQSLIEAGGMPYPDPFYSGVPLSPDKEVGFHLFLGEFKLITGASWLNLIRFLPGIIFALLAFVAYAFGKRREFGLGAAFLVALIPTTVRFLGPAFLVPVALGLTFIPVALLTLQRLMFDLRGPVVLFLIFLSLLFIHPPTLAVISGIAVIHFILFSLPAHERPRGRVWQPVVGLALLLSVGILTFFWMPSALDLVTREAMDPEGHLAASPIGDALPKFGYVPVALFVIGAGILIYRGKRHDWALVLSAAGLLAFEQIYPHFYIGPDIVYERGWLYTYVLMALLGGVALTELARWARLALLKRRPAISAAASYALVGVIVVSALSVSTRGHLSEQYDRLIDDAPYQDFLWVREYVPAQYGIGVLNTFVAWPFASVSGKFAYTAEVAPDFHAEGRSAMRFLQDGASDTSWLKEKGVTIVYTPWGIENNELIKVHNGVYLLVE